MIKNGMVALPQGIVSAGVAVDEGKIVAVAKDANLPGADETIDAGGNFILPGMIDPHLHIGWPDWPFDEGCVKDTAASAFGGVTTVINRLTEPGSLVEAVRERRRTMEERSHVDFALQVAVFDEDQIGEIPGLFEMGVCGFKFYIPYRGIEVVPPIVGIDDGILYLGLEEIAKLGHPARAQVHCENVEPSFKLRERLMKEGREDLAAWHDARPNFIEEESMRRCLFFAKITGCPLHIVHLSTKESIGVARRAKAEGMDVVTEMQPQYLTLTKHGDYGVLGKVNPPLRDRDDIEALWEGVGRGMVDVIGSDHAPCARKHKRELWSATVGFAGVETYIPVMMTEGVLRGRISLAKLVEMCSSNVAKVFGLYPRKGALLPGADADLVIFDLEKEVEVTADRLHHISDFTPYEGRRLRGWPILTMVRGNVVMRNGELIGKPGDGKFQFCGESKPRRVTVE